MPLDSAVATRSGRRPQMLAGAALLLVLLIGAIVIYLSNSPEQEPGGQEHCFAEWCIGPQSMTIDAQAVTVRVRVRSDAKQASQRPDHPQAWVIDATGRQIGGPQPALDDLLAAGDSYTTNLTFTTSQPGSCPRLRVSEGGWPQFLGLGYAASPFTATVVWRLCDIAGGKSAA